MSKRHLRHSMLSAVSSTADLTEFRKRFGAIRFNSSTQDLNVFEDLYRAKVRKYDEEAAEVAIEAELAGMRGLDTTPSPATLGDTSIEGAVIPLGGA